MRQQDDKVFYGFAYYLTQNIHCVKTEPASHYPYEQYTPAVYKLRTPEQAVIDDVALKEGRIGIELITGRLSQVVALDIEDDNLAVDQEFNSYVPETDCVKLGRKGETRFYQYNGEAHERFYDATGNLLCEILSDCSEGKAPKLCALPPSLHPKTQQPYLFDGAVPIRRATLTTFPDEALEYLRRRFRSSAYKTDVVKQTTEDREEGNALNEYPFIVAALKTVPADLPYPDWYNIAMSLRHALGCKLGKQIFTEWSSGDGLSSKFVDFKTQGMIDEFFNPARTHRGNYITIATLYSIAKAYGYKQLEIAVDNLPELLPTTSPVVTPAPVMQRINYQDHPVQVAQAFCNQGGEQRSVVFYNDSWYAYSEVRKLWWQLADTALIDRQIELFILNNGYNYIPDRDSKIKTEVPLSEEEQDLIIKQEQARQKLIEAGLEIEKRGRPKKLTKTVIQCERVACIDIRQSAITEVRNAVARLSARDTQIKVNSWLDDANQLLAPDCIAIKNGILDIRKSNLYSHSPHFFNTAVMPVEFAGTYREGMCPRWLDSLNLYFSGEQDCINQLQLAFGYTILSSYQLKKIVCLLGDRHSGKTTITNVLSSLIGNDNVAAGSNHSLTDSFGFANVDKAKMLLLEEFSLRELKGREIDALKRLTGGGAILINQKHEKAYSAKVSTRVWITTNDDPSRYVDSGRALSDRMLFFHCSPIPDAAKIPNYEDILLAQEASGILAWALQGCERILAGERLDQPRGRSELLKTAFQLAGRNPWQEFVDDFIIPDTEGRTGILVADGYGVYQQFLISSGVRPGDANDPIKSVHMFSRKLAELFTTDPMYKHAVITKGTSLSTRAKTVAIGVRFLNPSL